MFEETPAWSPDGSRIVFARLTFQTQFDGKEALYVVNRDGSGETLLLEHVHFGAGPQSLAWSPDRRMIAFETSPAPDCTAIHLVDVASGRVRPLTSCTKKRDSALAPLGNRLLPEDAANAFTTVVRRWATSSGSPRTN